MVPSHTSYLTSAVTSLYRNSNGSFKGDMQIANDDAIHNTTNNQRSNNLPNSNLIHTRDSTHLKSNESLTNEKPESIRTTAVIHSLSPDKSLYDTSESMILDKNSDIYQNKLLPNVSLSLNDYPLQSSISQEDLHRLKPAPLNNHYR